MVPARSVPDPAVHTRPSFVSRIASVSCRCAADDRSATEDGSAVAVSGI